MLANDVSPSGRVLAVQSADDTETDDLVSVEILTNTVARVTASEALDRQLQFSYTISDGVNTATATVTVVPVPPLVKHQPPVAVDDAVNVRAGDIATVPVLANDYHPDSTAIHVLPELADTGALQGLAFVDDDVRFQAPDEPGTYTAVYTIGDDFEQTARANVRSPSSRRMRREPAAATRAADLARSRARPCRSTSRSTDSTPTATRWCSPASPRRRTSAASPSARARRSRTRRSPRIDRHRHLRLRTAGRLRRDREGHHPDRRDPTPGRSPCRRRPSTTRSR